MVSSSARILPGVVLGEGVEIGEYVVIGHPFRGMAEGEVGTVIGDGAIIRSHTVIYAGCRLGRAVQTGHGALIREHTMIGDDVSIGSAAVVEHRVVIEDGVRIHSQAFVPEFSHLKRGCWLGPNAVLTNAKYPQSPGVKEELEGPTVEEGAMIGANATVLPGLIIGRRALVGAGSVVTRDVAAGVVVAGNPARVISRLDDLPY
jgi:acetyltransferase-like isoleucine patch superfamily enzyme